MAQVSKQLIHTGFLAPKTSGVFVWKVTQSSVWWFYAVPTNNQSIYPQKIQIDLVRIYATEPTKVYAHIQITNPSSPQPPDFPWQDGCQYDLYVASAT